MQRPRSGDGGVKISSGKDGEDPDNLLPLSHFIKRMHQKSFDVSSVVVGDRSETSGRGAKDGKTSPGKNVVQSTSCKTPSSGKGMTLPNTNVVVVMSDYDSENDEFFG